jgi:nucleoside-diphosphate-sugar epimerase
VLTGASGFLGRAFLQALPEDCTVFATYRGASDFPGWAEGCAADVRPVRIDLASERLADRIPAVDWGMLMAARVATAASVEDPVGELQAVAGVTVNAIRDLKVERVVHVSSGSVYETLGGRLGPDRVPAPRLPYSVAKLSAEHLFAAYADAPFWIIRFFGAFGPGEPPFKLARRLAETFARGEHRFALSGDGQNRIDPMYIEEAALRLASTLDTPGECRPVDLTQGERLTVRRFAEIAYEAAHPAPHEQALELDFTGAAHEQMQGYACTDPGVWREDLEHIDVAEGFRRYAAALAAR